MLYCYGETIKTIVFGSPYDLRGWKIYHKNLNDDNGVVVDTPQHHPEYGEVILECNPHPVIINNEIYLYYTAGFYKQPNSPIKYKLCSIRSQNMVFSSLDHNSWTTIIDAFSATRYMDNLIFSKKINNKSILYKQDLATGDVSEIVVDALIDQWIYKINKIFNENLMIITTPDQSILLNDNLSYIKNITNNQNQNIYKCSILDNVLAYTIKHNDSRLQESRSIVIEDMDY